MTIRPSDLLGPRAARRKAAEKRRAGWRIALLLVAGIVVSVAAYAYTLVNHVLQGISEPVSPEVAPEARPAPVQVGQRINFLVMGLDDDRLRSDVMMLVSLDPETHKVGVLQIPRDTRALLAGKGTIEKINAAYAFGVGDKRFPANLRALKTVEDLLDIRIHHTVVINLDGFRKAIDEIGGVWVDIPFAMDYDDPEQNLHIHLMPGRQKLTGKQALEFVRWRRNNDGTGYPDGDLGRIRTQQQFLLSVMDELFRRENLTKLPSLAVTLSRFVDTTVEPGQVLSLAKLAAAIRKEDVEFATLPGTDAYLFDPQEQKRLSFFVPDPDATRKLVDRLVRGIDPAAAAQVQVQVAMSGGDERAERLAQRLAEMGFAVSTAPREGAVPDRTRMIDLRGDEAKREVAVRALTSLGYSVEAVTQADSQTAADVRIVLGRLSSEGD